MIGLFIALACTPNILKSQTNAPALGIAVGIDAIRWQGETALAREFADYRRLGAQWIRTDLNWSIVQSEGPDSYDWSTMDRVVDLAERNGLKVLPVVGSVPDWAWRDPGTHSAPRNPDEFARFLDQAIERYRPRGIHVWEVWNEPNMSGFWPDPDPKAYAELLIVASRAIRAADPEAMIVSGGLASAVETGDGHHGAVEFVRTLYEEGAGDAFDALGFHPYSHPLMPADPAPWNGWSLMEGPIREIMEANGDGAKPVWITEYGIPTNEGPGGSTEAEQVEMFREAVSLAAETPWIGPLFWYSYRDLGDDPDDAETAFGLVREPSRPKPVYDAFRTMSGSAGSAP